MTYIDKVKTREPAKGLNDITIPDETWKPDFDIVDRYQNFANELMRVALFGIAGYGYLVTNICLKDDAHMELMAKFGTYLGLGGIFLVLCLIFVLSHRFYSTKCLYCQVMIMRSLKRLDESNLNWNEEDRELERDFLKTTRDHQRKQSTLADYVLKSASVCFAIGFTFVIIVFFEFLQAVPKIHLAVGH